MGETGVGSKVGRIVDLGSVWELDLSASPLLGAELWEVKIQTCPPVYYEDIFIKKRENIIQVIS